MPSFSDNQLILTGAITEALRARHHEIGVDHLLLGLVSAGGPSAAILARQGVGLAELRAASADLDRDVLTAAGVGMPGRTPDRNLTQRQQQELIRRGDWNFTPEAKSLGRALQFNRSDDRSFLAAVLDDAHAVEYLRRAGLDLDAVRTELATDEQAPLAADHEDDADTVSVERLISAPLGELWPLVSDPRARLRWDSSLDDATLADDGTLRQIIRGAGRSAEVTHRLTVVQPPHDGRAAVMWVETQPAFESELTLELTEAGGGTRLRLVQRLSRPRNLLQRVSRRWTKVFDRAALGRLAQGLNQAAADARSGVGPVGESSQPATDATE